MTQRSAEIDVGQRIAAGRHQRGLSQETVARRSRIDASYLSRIENGKVHPTVRTALRVATAIRMPLDELLGPSPPDRKGQPCPVSSRGTCLLDLIDVGSDAVRGASKEGYSPQQLRLLRRLTSLVERSNPKTLRAVEVLLSELVPGAKSSTGKAAN